MEQTTKEAMGPKRLKKGGKKPLIITGIVLAAAIAAYLGLCVWAGFLDTFFRGYTINGVDVGGLTVTQAQEKLERELPEREVPIYEAPDGTYPYGTENEEPLLTMTLAQLGFTPEAAEESVGIPFSDWARSALESQKESPFFIKGFSYLSSLFGEDSIWFGFRLSGDLDAAAAEITAQLEQEAVDAAYELGEDSLSITKARDGRSVDQTLLRQTLAQLDTESAKVLVLFSTIPAQTLTVQEIYDETSGQVKNAAYDAATDTIVPEQMGADFDVAAAQIALDAAAPGDTVTIPAQVELPTVTAEDLETLLFRDVLGQAQTKVGGTSARKSNVQLSAAAINEYVLNPGDVFSYNDVVGQRTAARGYKPAPAYVQGETVDEIGGGICQTSSTLYLACLRSNLEITERYAHRYKPTYIDPGMDATVSWGGPDYKFTNNTDYPIKIVTTYANSTLTVKILGTNIDGTYAKMTYEYLSTTPYEVIYEDDPTLAPGTEKVKTTPYTGYKYKTYRHVYAADGTLISSEYEATSDYKSRNKVILRGPALPDTSTTDPGTSTNPGTGTTTNPGTGTATDPGTTTDPGTATDPGTGTTTDPGTIVIVPETTPGSGTGENTDGLPTDVRPEDEPFL